MRAMDRRFGVEKIKSLLGKKDLLYKVQKCPVVASLRLRVESVERLAESSSSGGIGT